MTNHAIIAVVTCKGLDLARRWAEIARLADLSVDAEDRPLNALSA